MCIPGDHGAPFLVSSIQGSYSSSDSVPRLQTASDPVCHCTPCSHHIPLKPQRVATRALHLEVSLPACHTLSTSSPPEGEISLVSTAPFRPKFIHIILTLLFFLCWFLTCVNSDLDISTMTTSNNTRESDSQLTSSSRKLTWSFPIISAISDSRDSVKKPVSAFPLRRTTRFSLFRKRIFKRESSKGQGSTVPGAGASAASITVTTQLLNPALIHFICSRLPDPCARAAYLREHVRHELCLDIPFLYVLPNTTIPQSDRAKKTIRPPGSLYDTQSGTCRESGAHSLSYAKSDSLFETFLSSPNTCVRSLTEANQQIRQRLEPMFQEFDRLLDKSFCRRQSDPDLNVTGEFQCEECRDAYRSWLCTIVIQPVFPLQVWPEDELQGSVTDVPQSTVPLPSTKFPLPDDEQGESITHSSQLTGSSNSPNLIQSAWSATVRQATSIESRAPWIGDQSRRLNQQRARSAFTAAQQYRLVDVEPCVSWCTRVETLCPYFNPADPTANGGEPAFLCDEGHYHHSSRYQVIYRPSQLCESECCYSPADVLSLSHVVNVPATTDFSADSVEHSATEINSASEMGQAPSSTAPPGMCEPLELRCKHHGYSVVNRLAPSSRVSDPHDSSGILPRRNQPQEQQQQQPKPPVTSADSVTVEFISNRSTMTSSVRGAQCPSIRILGAFLLLVLCSNHFCGCICFHTLIFRCFSWPFAYPVRYFPQLQASVNGSAHRGGTQTSLVMRGHQKLKQPLLSRTENQPVHFTVTSTAL